MIVVTAALIIKEDKILIARRNPEKHLGGFWEFPGGKLEPGENEVDCLKREILEELGIDICVGSFFMENFHSYTDRQILLKGYFCKFLKGDIVLKDHDKACWIEKSELFKYNFAPADISFIKELNGKSEI